MSFYLRTLFIFSLIGLFLYSARATETRVSSMGGAGYYMLDNSNIFIFPGTLSYYRNQIVAEMRQKNNHESYSIGFHLPVDSNHVIAAYLNRPLNLLVPGNIAEQVQLDRAFDLFYGFKLFGDYVGLDIIIASDRYNEQYKDEYDHKINYEESASYYAFVGGFSSGQLDMSIKIEAPTTSSNKDNLKKNWSGIGLGLNTRLFVTPDNKIKFIPLVIFYGYKIKEDEQIIIDDVKDYLKKNHSALNIALGLGFNYNITEKNLFVLGLEGFGYSCLRTKSGETEYDERVQIEKILPGVYLGVESHIAKWLIGRFGATQINKQSTLQTKAGKTVIYQEQSVVTQFRLTFGLGVQLSNFLMDISLNEGLLFDGPNFISGSTELMANRLSLSYIF
jgi:hypothetical protein